MAKTLEVFFEPVDNARLSRLCGVLDENLRQIENAFDILPTSIGYASGSSRRSTGSRTTTAAFPSHIASVVTGG